MHSLINQSELARVQKHTNVSGNSSVPPAQPPTYPPNTSNNSGKGGNQQLNDTSMRLLKSNLELTLEANSTLMSSVMLKAVGMRRRKSADHVNSENMFVTRTFQLCNHYSPSSLTSIRPLFIRVSTDCWVMWVTFQKNAILNLNSGL